MDIWDVLKAMRAWWWLVVALPVVALIGAVLLTPAPPYESSFRSTVLIPGDTEDTGSAERPELMVLDDLAPLVSSRAFAEAVAAHLGPDDASRISVDDIQASLSGSRYSRIATVVVATDSSDETQAIANAAVEAFPDAVNTFLVAPGSGVASVEMIDPPGDPAQSQRQRLLEVSVVTFVAACAGTGLAALLETIRTSRRNRQRQVGSSSAVSSSAR